MRSAFAFAAVTVIFAGTLVGGLSYTGALDPDMLYGPKEDHPGAATAGWKTHSLPAAGFAIKLPPKWTGVRPTGTVVFEQREGKKVLASLTVVRSKEATKAKAPRGMHVKRFEVDGHVLTFSTSSHLAASYSRTFEHAAKSFRTLGSA
jgi:hypothetical protein